MDRFREMHEFASQYLVAGVSSAVRLSKALGHPFYTVSGNGSKLYGVDGKEYIDMCMSHGASFLGHNNPQIVKAIQRALELGIVCSHETEFHGIFAKKICDMVPSCELVRFTCSGTDATQHAIRVAREYTGKEKIIQFEGCFHGYHEGVMFSTHPPLEEVGSYENPNPVPTSGGIPRQMSELVKILPFNDTGILEKAIKKHKDQVAAVIVEPVGYNSGCMLATPEFVSALRELTCSNDILLIFDEILSGFRMGPGGAQEYFGVVPDLCTLGKAVAGGTPLSVFGGKKEIMEHVKPIGNAQHSGTYNGHLICIMAGIAALEQISSPGFYEHINDLAEKLYSGFNDIFQKRKIKGIVSGLGGMFGIYPGLEEEPTNYREIAGKFDSQGLLKFYHEAFKEGLYFVDYGGGPAHHGFSSMHSLKDIEASLEKIDAAVSRLRS
jgi:glutamate-1-semialdehyde 2,1-aminomutase